MKDLAYITGVPPQGVFKYRMASVTNNVVVNYFRTSYQELKKVTWPSREITIRYTTATIVLCAVMAAYFGVLDWALSKGLAALVSVTS